MVIQLMIVKQAQNSLPAPLQDMGVDHCGGNISVSKQRLDSMNVCAALQKVCGESVPKRMCANAFVNPYLTNCFGNGLGQKNDRSSGIPSTSRAFYSLIEPILVSKRAT